MNNQYIVKDIIKSIVFFITTLFILIFNTGDNFNLLVSCTLLLVVFQSSFMMIRMKSPLLKIYFLFSFLFFGCIPYIEHSYSISSYWGMSDVNDNTLVLVNILLFLLNFSIVISYRFATRSSFKKTQQFFSNNKLSLLLRNKKGLNRYSDKFILGATLSIFSTLLILYINDFNIINIIYRESYKETIKLNSSLSLIINTFIRPIPAVILIFYLAYKPINYKYKSIFFLTLCLISIFPTGVPRFYAAAVYIPIMVLLAPSLLNKERLNYIIIFSVFFIFPLLNTFRRFKEDQELVLFNGFDFLLHGHFDSYLSIGQTIQQDFVTYGYQLLGNLFFFVPRSLWESKPSGTGYTLANNLNLDFANISANYYAEGYANFGFIGMFLFSIILGALIRHSDQKLILKLSAGIGKDYIVPAYLISIGFLFFIMRGDLLSSLSYFVGFMLSCQLCTSLFKPVKN